jgi:hypothetical protein
MTTELKTTPEAVETVSAPLMSHVPMTVNEDGETTRLHLLERRSARWARRANRAYAA